MEVLILWFLCAAITAHIALEKNRSVFGWFLLGCFSGSFGIILIAYMPKLPSRADIAADKRAVAEFLKPKKRCPECAETILQAARVCRYCGYRFVVEPIICPPSLSTPSLDTFDYAVPLPDVPSQPEASRRVFQGTLSEASFLWP